MRVHVPISEAQTQELMEFWEGIFGSGGDLTRDVFLGSETEHNHHTVYVERRAEALAGTCNLLVSKRVPILGGVSAVATRSDLRRSGIGIALCRQAVEDFRAGGGRAVFLGSNTPEAGRVYHRLGWRKLAGAYVMANITDGEPPEAFLVDYFRDQAETTVLPVTPEVRLQIIPLLHSPHDWQVLDANVAMYSTRYCVQHSCMSLYRKYDAVRRDDRGGWFCAQTTDGRAVGLSTARLDDDGGCQVDGFAHAYYSGVWDGLIGVAKDWGAARSAGSVWASVSVEDEEKKSLYEGLGFRDAGPAGEFDLDGRDVAAVRLEL